MISGLLVRKWEKMIRNESVFHVNQMEGSFYSDNQIKGYYNDLRDKVRYTTNIDENGMPFNIATLGEKTKKVYFVISIFQYGLGAYDCYLETEKKEYREKMMIMADWAINDQADDGSWDAFGSLCYRCKVSSMAQGEGASLLARAYIETKEEKYLVACEKAIRFMLKPVDQGGTAVYSDNGLILLEYPQKAVVLNGWIFSAFGLLDCWKATGDDQYLKAWKGALQGIKNNIHRFDSGHWSYYDWNGKYTSPFYHKLHIELLKALNSLEPDDIFEKYIEKWTKCKNSVFWSKAAFIIKAKQKLVEKRNKEWIFVS